MSFEKLENYIINRDKNLIPECEIVICKNNERIYYKNFGNGAEPFDENKDMYYLFSATKVITATAALRLVERGIISLEDPVYKYLPTFKTLTVKGKPAKNVLTVRNLFSMTGGFTYNLDDKNIVAVKEKTNNKASTLEIVNAMANIDLIFEPGEGFAYSLCHDILAAVVEVASGKRFADFLKEEIFAPLGMNNTTFRINDSILKRMKKQYRVNNMFSTAQEISPECAFCLSDNYDSGGAGLISNLNDYALFADALASGHSADGYVLLKPQTVELMRSNQLCGKSYDDFKTGVNKIGYSYGLGVRTLIDNNLPQVNPKVPLKEFGWDSAAGAYVMICPEKKLSVFYAQHVLDCGYAYSTIHPTIRNYIFDEIGV